MPERRRVVILGGGMAGLSAAWRLSETNWQDQFESITVYQRGWRLGGKAASSRGKHDRIEEHGLHIWLGSYYNAFRLIKECYEELDRKHLDPDSPIKSWRQAFVPSRDIGLAEQWGTGWETWIGRFPETEIEPGGGTKASDDGRRLTTVEFVLRGIELVSYFIDSIAESAQHELVLTTTSTAMPPIRDALLRDIRRALAQATAHAGAENSRGGRLKEILRASLDSIREALNSTAKIQNRRAWVLISMVVASINGIIADGAITSKLGFRALNDESFDHWILRHGAHPDVLDYPLVRGTYDLVFGYEDGDPARPAFPAGLMLFLTGVVLFTYQGALFWKMTAGMGDVVVAPIYQVLKKRGVKFEFFHRIVSIHADSSSDTIDRVVLGRQADLVDPQAEYDPLTRVGGLDVFPSEPLRQQVVCTTDLCQLESHFGPGRDVGTRTLVRGQDFDDVVLAVSIGMIPIVADEILTAKPEWRDMVAHVKTVATQSVQLWLRVDDTTAGWSWPGGTLSGFERPFETFASMSQTLWSESWPSNDEPMSVAYLCGSFEAPWPVPQDAWEAYASKWRNHVHMSAVEFLEKRGCFYLPGLGADGFNWRLLVGAESSDGVDALAKQYVSINIDPSDRYVQSIPGSDKYRLRPDESGYINLALAGDWTDSGINAGCIEAAVVSGLQAANFLLGRGRRHRIGGYQLP